MADPKQKSLEVPPYLVRIPTVWQSPRWAEAAQWRWFVYNQPIAMLCRQRLINYLQALPWEIRARDSSEQESLTEDIRYYESWVLRNFDIAIDQLWQDALDLPIGGNLEIVRWLPDQLPTVEEGEEVYRVTRPHPKGHVFDLVHIDGATLYPTFDRDFPIAQRIPESFFSIVYFSPNEIGRIVIQPRTEMRLRGYGKPPPEQVYLAMQMVTSGDHYYADLLKNIPPVGLLDLMDFSEQFAKDWASSTRTLFEGADPFKIPLLYEHEKPAAFIPFGKSPQELLFDTATLRYARIVAASYGLTLGNLGLEPKGETLAGSIRDDQQAATGYSTVVEKTKGLIDNQILPPYLEWLSKDTNFEKATGKGRAFLVTAQALKTAKEAGALLPSEVQAQLIYDGFITVEVKEPDDEPKPLMLPAPAKNGLPDQADPSASSDVTDKKPPAEGGRGDITGKAEVQKADLTRLYDQLAQPLAVAFAELREAATPERLEALIRAAIRALLSQAAKAGIDDDLDELLSSEDWYIVRAELAQAIVPILQAAVSEGATIGAELVQRALFEAGMVDTPSINLSFNLKNPRTLAELEAKAALLVRRVNEGTRYYLREIIKAGVEQGLASPNIARMIESGAGAEEILESGGFMNEVITRAQTELASLSPERIESIVNTEINRSESEGRLAQWREMGLTRKAWRTHAGACDICKGNEALGFVEMGYIYDDVFDGTLTPPGHPRVCRCHLEFDEQELIDKADTLTIWTGE